MTCDINMIMMCVQQDRARTAVSHLQRSAQLLGHQRGTQLLPGSVDDWKVSYFAFCEPSQLHALVSKKRYKDVT